MTINGKRPRALRTEEEEKEAAEYNKNGGDGDDHDHDVDGSGGAVGDDCKNNGDTIDDENNNKNNNNNNNNNSNSKIPIFVFDSDEEGDDDDIDDEDLTTMMNAQNRHDLAKKRRQKQERKVLDAYKQYQAVIIRRRHRRSKKAADEEEEGGKGKGKSCSFSWKDIQSLYQNLNVKDQESFCIESSSATTTKTTPSSSAVTATTTTTALEFLRPEIIVLDEGGGEGHGEASVLSASAAAAYCSFLVQHDRTTLRTLLEQLPVREILSTTNIVETVKNGRNDNDESGNNGAIASRKSGDVKNEMNHTDDDQGGTKNKKQKSKNDENENDDDTTATTNSSSRERTRPLGIDHEPCVWIFFGRNYCCYEQNNNKIDDNDDGDGDQRRNRRRHRRDDLLGRPEHTDSISHDGTWHYQLSGTKRWYIRPTTKLLEHFDQLHQPYKWDDTTTNFHQHRQNKKSRSSVGNDKKIESREEGDNINCKTGTGSIQVDCHQGDVFIINTRLWYHQTVLPPQPDPSVSYARDFWLRPKRETTQNANNEADQPTRTAESTTDGGKTTGVVDNDNDDDDPTKGITMTNVDGLYATEDIEEGTVIFREDTMPDIELHRSATNANCDVVEVVDEHGVEIQAVVSTRPIVAGEFFCMPESDDEGEEEGEEEDFEDIDEE